MEWIVAGWVIVLFGLGLVAMHLSGQRQQMQRVRSTVRVVGHGNIGAKARIGNLDT